MGAPGTVIGSSINPYEGIFRDTSYVLHSQKMDLHGRVIKYELKNTTKDSLVSATKAIAKLLSENKELCPLFSPENLETQIERKKYLIINVRAVCLSEECEAPAGLSRYADHYFSQALLKEPVKCSQQHAFEREYTKFWMQKNGNICPASDKKHEIGEGGVDVSLQRDIVSSKEDIEFQARGNRDIRETTAQLTDMKKSLEAEKKELENDRRELSLSRSIHKQQLEDFENKQKKHNDEQSLREKEFEDKQSLVLKVETQLLATTHSLRLANNNILINYGEAAKNLAHKISEKFGIDLSTALIALRIGKVIPGISFILGITIAVYRCQQLDRQENEKKKNNTFIQIIQVVGEILSGALACVPILGTAGSILIDAGVGNLDADPLYQAYQFFGLSEKATKQEVDDAYKKHAMQHPDLFATFGPATVSAMSEIFKHVHSTRDIIYKHNGWDKQNSDSSPL